MNNYFIYFSLFIFSFIIFMIFGCYLMKERKNLGQYYKGNLSRDYDKVMIVAHPDDEMLWGGMSLINYKKWKVVCVTNGNNKKRRNEFITIMNKLNHNYEIWSYEDCFLNYNLSQEIYKDINNLLVDPKIKYVVTHNVNGEYGHVHHKKIFQVVMNVSKKPVYVFNYSNNKISENIERLKSYQDKKKICQIYKSQRKSINLFLKKNIIEKFIRVKN